MNRPIKLIRRKLAKKQLKQYFFGIPVSFDAKKIFWNFWDPSQEKIILEKHWGIGWDLNFHALLKKINILSKTKVFINFKTLLRS